jgi:hypothetical protein
VTSAPSQPCDPAVQWTCGVGQLAGGRQLVTVVKWRAGRIAEEHIFMGGIPDRSQ